jgi:diketogulonate reductase-like aldo/keto reductase
LSCSEDEIAENIDIFDFELTDEDLEKMQQLDTGIRFFTMSESEQERAFAGFAPDFNNQK